MPTIPVITMNTPIPATTTHTAIRSGVIDDFFGDGEVSEAVGVTGTTGVVGVAGVTGVTGVTGSVMATTSPKERGSFRGYQDP